MGKAQEKSDDLVGQTLLDFKLTKVMAVGWSSTIYEAIDSKGQKLAVKILNRDLAENPALVKQFLASGWYLFAGFEDKAVPCHHGIGQEP